MSTRRPLLAAGLAALAAACAGDGGNEWQGTVRDSAGIAIVENPTRGMWSADERPTITEVMRIGTTEGAAEQQFGLIAGIDVDADGHIYVLDQQSQSVRVFGPDGTFLREMGGPGGGPGELGQGVFGLLLTAGDTVLVPDPAQARITRYAPDGTVVESTPLNVANGIPMRWELTPERTLINQVRTFPVPPQPGQPPSEMRDWLLVRASDGSVRDTIMELPVGQTFQFQQGGARIRLFEPEPVWTLATDGRIIFGMNSEYRLNVLDASGQLQRIITFPYERRPVTEADQAAFREAIQEAWQNAGVPPAAMDQLLAGLSFAETYPAFANLIGGPDGTVWVQHVRTAEEVAAAGGEFDAQDVGASDFDVFDPEGRFLGVLGLPDRFQPWRIIGNRIYGVWRDDLDVQHVMVLEYGAAG